jgi:hypothetical protein
MTRSPKGAERIAARRADHRKVPQVAFRPNWTKHAKSAPFTLAAGGVRQGVAFVEHDGSIEVRSQPIDDLADAGNSFLACIGAQRGVGRK